MSYIVTHENEIYRAETQNECRKFVSLVSVQSGSADQALEHEGFAIHEVKD